MQPFQLHFAPSLNGLKCYNARSIGQRRKSCNECRLVFVSLKISKAIKQAGIFNPLGHRSSVSTSEHETAHMAPGYLMCHLEVN